ncbi:MAG TPA: hypothetical protein VK826_03645 [Bacteroidia bacterium]|nr:hypothetical protein [Bacteroidia bacterium]
MADQNFIKLVLVISCIPVLGAAIYAAIIFKQLGKTLKLFSLFLFLSAAIQVASGAFWWFRINNMPLLHFYTAAGFVCISLFYRKIFRDVLDGRIMIAAIILFLFFAIYNAIPPTLLLKFNSTVLTVESVIIIIFSLSTFILFLNEHSKEIRTADSKSINWINSGLLIYYSSNLLLFYFGEIMDRSFPVYLSRYSWILHDFFSATMYFCFFVGLWKRHKA